MRDTIIEYMNKDEVKYGVATIRRLRKIIGLFCIRALQKRRCSAKETYDFKEPTGRSHPIGGKGICMTERERKRERERERERARERERDVYTTGRERHTHRERDKKRESVRWGE